MKIMICFIVSRFGNHKFLFIVQNYRIYIIDMF